MDKPAASDRTRSEPHQGRDGRRGHNRRAGEGNGLSGLARGRNPTARVKAAEVAEMKAAGKSVRAVAEALEITVGSVHGMLKASA